MQLRTKGAPPLKRMDLYREASVRLSQWAWDVDCSGSASKNNRGLFQLFVKAAQVETDEKGAEKKSYSCTPTARHNTQHGGRCRASTIWFRQSKRLLGHSRSFCRTLEEDQLSTRHHTHSGHQTDPMPALVNRQAWKCWELMNMLNATTFVRFSSNVFSVCIQ